MPLEAGRSERILTMKSDTKLADILAENEVDAVSIANITAVLSNVMPALTAPMGARIRLLFGASRNLARADPLPR